MLHFCAVTFFMMLSDVNSSLSALWKQSGDQYQAQNSNLLICKILVTILKEFLQGTT